MRRKKNHLYVDSQERGLILHSLVELKNQLIQQGGYGDCADELNEQIQARILPFVFNDLEVSGVIINDTGKLLFENPTPYFTEVWFLTERCEISHDRKKIPMWRLLKLILKS